MNNFNREYALKLLKDAVGGQYRQDCQCHAISINKMKMINDNDEMRKIYHVKKMEQDKILKVCDGSNDSLFGLELIAYEIIESGVYPESMEGLTRLTISTKKQGYLNFQESYLWKRAFDENLKDEQADETMIMRDNYLMMRENIIYLISKYNENLPSFTVHNIDHLDSLWEMASILIDDNFEISPTEAFVFGASILLHDSRLGLLTYSDGIVDLMKETTFKDQLVFEAKKLRKFDMSFDLESPPNDLIVKVTPIVLKNIYASRIEKITKLMLKLGNDINGYIIPDSNIRKMYGSIIGRIVKSVGNSVESLEIEFPTRLDPSPEIPSSSVDGLKLACLLRLADAIHIEHHSNTPNYMRSLIELESSSDTQWHLQQRMMRPHVEKDHIVFTTGSPFKKNYSNAWWLVYETLKYVNKEIIDVNALLQSKSNTKLKVKQVSGISSPNELSKFIKTKDWQPIDIQLHVSDVELLCSRLGGTLLYGNDQRIPLRELIQNATDAIRARRIIEEKQDDWGEITVGVFSKNDNYYLFVEDCGIGMSENVLTGALLDFGKSFWGSSDSLIELPGLLSSGMNSIGKFGIGFFSVFMLGDTVSVYTRRFNEDCALLLEFAEGTNTKPVLSLCSNNNLPINGGTRVEIRLKNNPFKEGGLFSDKKYYKFPMSLGKLVGSIAPCLNVDININEFGDIYKLSTANDWLSIRASTLLNRICNNDDSRKLFLNEREQNIFGFEGYQNLIQPIIDKNGRIYGRASIDCGVFVDGVNLNSNCVVVNGLRSGDVSNLCGVIFGEIYTIDRSRAHLSVPHEALTNWVTKQADLITTHISDGYSQAKAAEVVLHYGGDIKDLKFVRNGKNWYTESELRKYLREHKTIKLIPEYLIKHRSNDETSFDNFRNYFLIDEDIFVVPIHNGEITNDYDGSTAVYEDSWATNTRTNLLFKIVSIVEDEWKLAHSTKFVERKIGTVKNCKIERYILVFENNV